MLNTQARLQTANNVSEECIFELQSQAFSMINGAEFLDAIELSKVELERFSSHWSNLVLDEHMADGGLYRYRRYGQFYVDSQTKETNLMPHESYVQPSYINNLNGDVQRFFEPLEKEFVESDALKKILTFLTRTYNDVLSESINWNIRLHPYRVIASDKITGLPTPEGLHRDGVTFIASLLIHRNNISGGTTTITDSNKHILEQVQLTKSFDLMMADDAKTMHEVSSLKPINKEETSYRDVLVIAFTNPNDIPL